jgi:hypothetical protein
LSQNFSPCHSTMDEVTPWYELPPAASIITY